ncbi:hypothetical protein BDZ88DRAFT_428791 [Geranomyces variabilis]|nr:hypothetical protein BDZ88DRAFT_428791 [Geranomyces variabilis]KAJ3132322.1 hypothetical protein HDU90_007383 [Geranomyces variabilis]
MHVRIILLALAAIVSVSVTASPVPDQACMTDPWTHQQHCVDNGKNQCKAQCESDHDPESCEDWNGGCSVEDGCPGCKLGLILAKKECLSHC